MAVHRDGKLINVEFSEASCNTTENDRRKDKGRIQPHYECVQMKSHKVLFRDVAGKTIEVRTAYRAGCELRCTTATCLRQMCEATKNQEQRAEICDREAKAKVVIHAG